MSKIIVVDLETFYDREFSLSKIQTEEYVRDRRFETIGIAIKDGLDGETKWYPRPEVKRVLPTIDWGDALVVCQNTAFDGAILKWRYGVNPKGWIDIMGMSRALYPHEKSHSLKAQAERAGIGQKGDEVIHALGKRYADFSPEELSRYGAYCINDVELTAKLFEIYMAKGFPLAELRLIDLTLRMFIDARLQLDVPLLQNHLEEVRDAKRTLLNRIVAKHGSVEEAKSVLMSNPRFAEALRELGVEPPTKVSPTTGKVTYAFAKTDEEFKALEEHPNPDVQALVAARLGTKTTLEETRTEALIGVGSRGPLPIGLRYYGALTGRWTAEGGLQFQNIPRDSPMKKAIKAPEGYVICGADLSNIELRLGLWLADQQDRIQMIADGRDLYKDFAMLVYNVPYEGVTKDQRQVGKVANLSLIYGTGATKLREAIRVMGRVKVPLQDAQRMVPMYRTMYSKVVDAWRECEQAMHAMVHDQHRPLLRNGIFTVEGSRGIRLPSGMYMQYPNLRRQTNADTNKSEWVFDSKHGVERLYGAKLFQGLTQATARCIMADGLRRLDAKVSVVLTVHDSAYWLALKDEAEESLAWGIQCITAPVSYCPGLPLAAEGASGVSYGDC